MKSLLKYFSIFTLALLAFSCDFDENGPMPDEMVEAPFPYIVIDSETSSPFLNQSAPEDYVLNGTINIIFDEVPFDKLRFVVSYNDGFNAPYTLVDNITTVPQTVSITGADIINAIDEISDANDISLDDKFYFYVIPTVNGVDYPPYQVLNGKVYNTVSSSIYQNLNAFAGVNSADVTVNVMRVCALENGMDDLAGSWTGDDAWYNSIITTAAAEGNTISASGMGVGFIEDWWGEAVIDSEPITMTITEFGTVEIPRQYLFTTEWGGDPYDYEIVGSGFWNNCGDSPTLLIQYDIYYAGEAVGLAAKYAAYLDGIPYLTADITLDNSAAPASFMITKSLKSTAITKINR